MIIKKFQRYIKMRTFILNKCLDYVQYNLILNDNNLSQESLKFSGECYYNIEERQKNENIRNNIREKKELIQKEKELIQKEKELINFWSDLLISCPNVDTFSITFEKFFDSVYKNTETMQNRTKKYFKDLMIYYNNLKNIKVLKKQIITTYLVYKYFKISDNIYVDIPEGDLENYLKKFLDVSKSDFHYSAEKTYNRLTKIKDIYAGFEKIHCENDVAGIIDNLYKNNEFTHHKIDELKEFSKDIYHFTKDPELFFMPSYLTNFNKQRETILSLIKILNKIRKLYGYSTIE